MSSVQLITSTPDAEKSMAYIARVSNPKNQDNDDFTKLIGYCIKNEHWSVFEQAYMTLQIETNRGIAAQILIVIGGIRIVLEYAKVFAS